MVVNVSSKIDSNVWGYLGVTPLATLKDTALELSQILEVDFYEDDSGKYDEFPAYCAESKEYEFALLGIPDEKEYLGEEPLDGFQLQIKNSGDFKLKDGESLANHFLSLISSKSSLKCWLED